MKMNTYRVNVQYDTGRRHRGSLRTEGFTVQALNADHAYSMVEKLWGQNGTIVGGYVLKQD
jgi:hypothetical protein